jgi:hypothetical protein
MNDDELRAMIREAIARHLGSPGEEESSANAVALPPSSAQSSRTALAFTKSFVASTEAPFAGEGGKALAERASHLQFPLQRGGDGDGACLIEPSVRCNHCGYCLCYGH